MIKTYRFNFDAIRQPVIVRPASSLSPDGTNLTNIIHALLCGSERQQIVAMEEALTIIYRGAQVGYTVVPDNRIVCGGDPYRFYLGIGYKFPRWNKWKVACGEELGGEFLLFTCLLVLAFETEKEIRIRRYDLSDDYEKMIYESKNIGYLIAEMAEGKIGVGPKKVVFLNGKKPAISPPLPNPRTDGSTAVR